MLEQQLNAKKAQEAILKKELEECKKELSKQKEAADKLKGRRKSANEEPLKSRENSKGKLTAFKKTADLGRKVEISIMDSEEKPKSNQLLKVSSSRVQL